MSTSHLSAVPSAGQHVSEHFLVAAQASVAGPQERSVRVVTPLTGPGKAQIAVRVGRLLVYVANREALASFLQAWAEASRLADQAFGPTLPPPRYQPRK